MAPLIGTYPSFALANRLLTSETQFESRTFSGLANHALLSA